MSGSIPTKDRISSLPDSIICHHILSLLPTKLAATTSILSKRWNPLWLSVLTLHFDDETFKDFISFRHFVSSVFLLRDITLPLRSFHLKCSNASSLHPQDINRFVHAAAQRGITNLILQMSDMLTLPRTIFSCRTLVVLHLKGITVNDISNGVVDFPLLKTLHLSFVIFKHVEYFVEFLLGCPILEELQGEHLSVHNVEWFHIQKKSVVVEKFVVEKFLTLPNLIRASITKSPSYLTMLITVLCITEVQVLRAELDTGLKSYPTFHNLTYVELILNHNFHDKWKWLLGMLKRCPKLQHLTIHEDIENGEEVVDNWLDPEIIPECLSTQLKTCLLIGFKCTKCGLEFAKYIMQNSKVLNTMTIKSASSIDTNAKYQMLMKSASWTRASSTCKLLFD